MKNQIEILLSDDEKMHRLKQAAEVAAIGIAIWKLRSKFRHYSTPTDSKWGEPRFIPPVSVMDGEREVYVYPGEKGFDTGIIDPEEGLMGIVVNEYEEYENGKARVTVDPDISELDPTKLEMIRSSLERVRDKFRSQTLEE